MNMLNDRIRHWSIALLVVGGAIVLLSCDKHTSASKLAPEAIMTEHSENLSIVVSENGRKSYCFTTPLLEGYMLGRDPYREFRRGVSITTFQDDSMTTMNTNLVANYAIYYDNRKLWEAKGDVVVTKHDGTKLYTQQLFWNSKTKRVYSNVDTKIVTATDTFIGEGFESDEDLVEPRFRRWKGKLQVDSEQMSSGESGRKSARQVAAPPVERGGGPSKPVKTSTSHHVQKKHDEMQELKPQSRAVGLRRGRRFEQSLEKRDKSNR